MPPRPRSGRGWKRRPSPSRCGVGAILALRLNTGAIAWADHTLTGDEFSGAHLSGPDLDFGAGPNLITIPAGPGRPAEQFVGIGQKTGFYYALDPGTGRVVWSTQFGPGSIFGGTEWGTATDGQRVYVAEADANRIPYQLGGDGPDAGQTVTSGSWAALDARTGRILWQVPDPQSVMDTGFTSEANGVVYVGSNAGTGTNMYALDAATGKTLFSFASGGAVVAGAAIAGGTVYWGSGYTVFCPGVGICGNNNKLYALAPP